MKLWTYAEARDKTLVDCDLLDEAFVTPSELIGYFNEGIEEAESEILKIDEEYFLSPYSVPLVQGQSTYAFPVNMYAFKERGLVYSNGAIIYDVKRFPRKDKFVNIAFSNQYSSADDYRWYPTNDATNGALMNLVPPSRETAIVPPNTGTFTPLVLWYIRHANRVPLIGEYIPQYEQIADSAINNGTDTITIAKTYVTGDKVKFTTTGTLPGGITAGVVYYAISTSATTIKLAASLALARAGTAIDLTGLHSGIHTISIAANQTIIDNTVIDIPEFTKFVLQWVKCRCFEKEGDPRLAGATATLEQQRMQMVNSLTEAQPDDQNEITPDLSSYNEIS